ncbi:hypothetical protein ASF49_05050 [Methylobacterium sp. Leaf104]|uniref:hypothetical protein n=1 Tax=Methylobacterium TaxID=407 RepID=UPI0006F77DAF|nr:MULTISPECIES: hypothetical protein [Methylobacterium]KQP38371.1 hypothetical protein ASF49_05050 [Methylobacterium sp. Leaf104]MCI9880224.1 hypothetical protein [Methylobacterium goesingense]
MRFRIALLAVIGFGAPAFAQSSAPAPGGGGKIDAELGELRAAPVPSQAKDLDTLQLASAQRERAASIEEKTNGLWQSWTVSICEGCGATPSYRKTIDDDFANRKRLADLKSKTAPSKTAPAKSARQAPEPPTAQAPGRSLYADLSTENISQIRRMPGR